jgi:hypothetical protein
MNQGRSTLNVIGKLNVAGWNALMESQAAKIGQSRDQPTVYDKLHSFANATGSINLTSTQLPTAAWPPQHSSAQFIITQFSRKPALKTPSLAARRSSTIELTTDYGDAYTTSFPINVGLNKQTDRRDM